VLDQARRLDGGRPLYLTVTHSHPEHGFGVQAFRGAATIIYNTAQLEELRRKGRGHIEMLTGMSPAYAAELGDVELTGPDITYDGRAEIDRGGHTAVLQSRGPATASVPARVSHSRRRYPLRETTPVRADLSVARVARDLDVGVHHLLGELPDYRLQHVRARRRQGLLELRAGTGTMSPAATSLSFVAPKPLRRIARWPPGITATCRTPARQSPQYRLPHTPLPCK